MTIALAAPPWGHAGSGSLFLLGPLVWLVVLVLAFVLLRRGARRRWAEYGGPAFGPHRSPESTLAERFANGEVDEVEYRARLQVLRANRPQRR